MLLRRLSSLIAVLSLCGCTTDAINVSEGVLAENVNYQWLLSSREGEKAVFSPMDEKVVLSVRFDYNYRASYEWYKVEWIAPSGEAYKVVSTRTEFASHRDLKAELLIRGKMAAALPGLWRVRLTHLGREDEPDRLLISRLFRIEPMTPEMLASIRIDPPPADERPLAGELPPGAIVEPGSVVAEEAQFVTPDSVGPSPRARAPEGGDAESPTPGGEALAAASEPPAPAVTASASAAVSVAAVPPPPSPGSSGSEPVVVPGVLSAGLSGSQADSATAASPDTTGSPDPASLRFRRRWPGCPPLYYPPGEGCVEQAPEE